MEKTIKRTITTLNACIIYQFALWLIRVNNKKRTITDEAEIETHFKADAWLNTNYFLGDYKSLIISL